MFTVSLKLYYDLPLLSWLGLNINGGPAFHLVKYDYSLSYRTTAVSYTYSQSAEAAGLGFYGGLGLTFRINPRTIFFVEAQGRYAKFASLKGSEKTIFSNPPNFVVITETAGSVYYIEGDKYPKLEVFPDEASVGPGVRKAVLNLSGIGLMGGVMIRF